MRTIWILGLARAIIASTLFADQSGAAVANANLAEEKVAVHSRTLEMPPLRMSYDHLRSLLTKCRALAHSANANYSPGEFGRREYVEELELVGKSGSLELATKFSFEQWADAPEIAYRVNYRYGWGDAPLSGIRIRLADYERSVTVTGSSKENVEAIAASIAEDLGAHRTVLGGGATRFWLYALCSFCAIMLVPIVTRMLPSGSQTSPALVVCGLLSLALLVISFKVMSADRMFSGLVVVKGDASWTTRYSAVITLWGFILSVVFFVVSLLVSVRLSAPNSSLDTTPKQAPPDTTSSPENN